MTLSHSNSAASPSTSQPGCDGAPRADTHPARGAKFLDPRRAAEAAAALKASLGRLAEDDPDLALDMIEGETNLFECVDALLARMADTRVHIEGVKAVAASLADRKARFEARLETDRALIEQAMMIADIPKLERPVATLSLAQRGPKLEIDSEADIPGEFWITGEPKLDRKALSAALAERAVSGAHLTNAAPSLTVRTK